MSRSYRKLASRLMVVLMVMSATFTTHSYAKFVSPDHKVEKNSPEKDNGQGKNDEVIANFNGDDSQLQSDDSVANGKVDISQNNVGVLQEYSDDVPPAKPITDQSDEQTQSVLTEQTQSTASSTSENIASNPVSSNTQLNHSGSKASNGVKQSQVSPSALKPSDGLKPAVPQKLRGRISPTDKSPNVISQEKREAIERLVKQREEKKRQEALKKLNKKSPTDKQSELNQGLIDAQIDDVLGSQEFIELQQADVFSQPKKGAGKTQGNTKDSEPEATLLLLDKSNLMDYVAEDDFWKEQLTIEDEPG